jgi:DNA-binding SARP family transcriptional activator
MTVRFRLFGAVEVRVDDRPVALGHAQLRCVLTVLLVEANQPVTVDQFIDRVWAEGRLPRQPRRAVHHNISLLRRALPTAPGVGLARSGAGYRLSVDADTVDLHRFQALSASSDAAARGQGDEQAAALLEQALSLWVGEPFADLDIDSAWLHHQRAALTAQRHTARLELTDIRLRQGRHSALLAELAAGATRHPFDERLAGQYLLALYRSGRQAEALQHYNRLQHLLAKELGTDPSPALRQLHQRILTADTALAPPTDQAPERATATAMFSMRADIPTFTGRHAELRTLLDQPRDDEQPDASARAIAIHTVDGMPGVGKTAFGVHAAHHLAHRFPDGNIFLDLRGHTPGRHPLTPGAALESLLRATGVDPKLIPPSVEDRARLWRDRLAGKRVLLVLDDALDHDQIRPLLPGTAGNLVLITSRYRLAALDGVTPLTLDVLPQDQALALLVRLAGRPLAPDNDKPAGMARIVACCGRLPLAIALAGAQLRCHPSWSATYLADLLTVEHDRLAHLEVGDRSVRAAFDMSFRHRPAPHQRLFRLLGVHPGPDIDAYATAALMGCSPREARRGLAGLHADHVIEETSAGRYRLHDLLRVYARDLAAELDPDDRDAALHRVLGYYQHTVRQATTHLHDVHTAPQAPVTEAPAHTPSLDDPPTAQTWLAAELSTLIACVHHAAASSRTKPASQLATALHPFLRASGYTDRALDVHHTALGAAIATGDQVDQATILTLIGDVRYLRGECAAATDSLVRAHDLYTAVGNRAGQANVLTLLGDVRYLTGEYRAAADSLTRAYDLFTAMGIPLGQAKALADLGYVYYLRGEYGAATETLTTANGLFSAMGNQLGQANTLTHLSSVRYVLGEHAAAVDNLTRALELFTTMGNRLGAASTTADLGIVRYRQGDYAAGTDQLTRALGLFTAMGNRLGEANTRTHLGIVRYKQGDYAAATDSLASALDLATALGIRLAQATALTHLGVVLRLRGEYRSATERLLRALAVFAGVGDPNGEAETLNNLGDLALVHPAAGDPHAYFGRALTIARNLGIARHEAHALAGQARCLLPTADPARACALLRLAYARYRALGVPEAVEVERMLSTLEHNGDPSSDQWAVAVSDKRPPLR